MSKTLDLIAKLLAQADGAGTEAEALTALQRAQTLATRNSIDLAVARAHAAKAEKREVPEERTIRLGYRGTKGLNRHVMLYMHLADLNDCECFAQSDSTKVYPLGMPSDLDVVDALYSSIAVQMNAAAVEHIKSGAYKRTRDKWVPGHGWRTVKVNALSARLGFYDGYIARVVTRLREAKDEAVTAALEEEQETLAAAAAHAAACTPDSAPGQALTSTALVLREKRAEVKEFANRLAEETDVTAKYRGAGKYTPDAESYRAGQEAGNNAQLHGRKSITA